VAGLEPYSSAESGRIFRQNPRPAETSVQAGSVGLPTLHTSEVSIVDRQEVHPVEAAVIRARFVRGACVVDGYDPNPTGDRGAVFIEHVPDRRRVRPSTRMAICIGSCLIN